MCNLLAIYHEHRFNVESNLTIYLRALYLGSRVKRQINRFVPCDAQNNGISTLAWTFPLPMYLLTILKETTVHCLVE